MTMMQNTELLPGTDGPWIAFQADNIIRMLNLRHIVRDRIEASDNQDEKRLLEQWLRDREAEGAEEKALPPPEENERRRRAR